MIKNWEITKIKEVCYVIAGQSPKSEYYNKTGDGLPFYQGKKEFTNKFIGKPTTWTTKITKKAQKDDILMSVRAPVGPVNFATEDICIGRGLAAIRASDLISKEYLFNFLKKNENDIEGNTGAVFNSINKSQIENILIPLPPLSEQQRIVALIEEAFEAIDEAKENTEKNLHNARELFESYLRDVFANPEDDWKEKNLTEVCSDIFAGGDAPKGKISKEQSEEYSIPIYANAVKDRGLYGYTNFARVTEPSITVAARGSGTGHTEIRYDSFLPIVRLIVLIPTSSEVILEFLKHAIDRLVILKGGSAIPQLTVPMIKGYTISLPPIHKQKEIVAKLEALFVEINNLEKTYQQKLTNLEELKKSILQKVFNGEF